MIEIIFHDGAFVFMIAVFLMMFLVVCVFIIVTLQILRKLFLKHNSVFPIQKDHPNAKYFKEEETKEKKKTFRCCCC